MPAEPQSYATHRRLDPMYHFVLATVLVLNLAFAITMLVRHHSDHQGLVHVWLVVMSLALLIMALKVRAYPLRAQDRIIRLEERLRMERVLPADLQARIAELRPGQFVGLRFASDAELADRVREALDQGLGGEEIKKRIQTWRPDTFRV